MQRADIQYVRTVSDHQRRLSQEHELGSSSAAHLRNTDSRGRGPASGPSRDSQGHTHAHNEKMEGFILPESKGGEKQLIFFDCSWRSLLPRQRRR